MSRQERFRKFSAIGETVFTVDDTDAGDQPFMCTLRKPSVLPSDTAQIQKGDDSTLTSLLPSQYSFLPALRTPSQSSSPLLDSSLSRPSSSRRTSSSVAKQMDGLIVDLNGIAEIIFLDSGDDEGPGILEETCPIGQGAEGTVYKAKACVEGDEEAVAIKKIPLKGALSNGSLIHRKLTEQNVSSCDHNILKLLKMKVKDRAAYLTLPFCDVFLDTAMTLMKRESIKPISPLIQLAMIAQVGSDILEALRYMHTFPHENGVGYVHRDIKPANIALKYSHGGWHAVLCDLDTAEEMGKTNRTQKGTLSFMHPLCFVKASADVTANNDLYQLGVTLLMLLGKAQSVLPPVALTTQMEIMKWKENKYQVENAQYEKAKKTAECTRMNAQRKAIELARLRMLSGLSRITLARELHPPVLPTLAQDLQRCSTIEDKLTLIGLHLTRCFEQPTEQDLENAFAEIRIVLIQNYADGKDALHQELENFYESLAKRGENAKPLKHTTSSFFRDYGDRSFSHSPSKSTDIAEDNLVKPQPIRIN